MTSYLGTDSISDDSLRERIWKYVKINEDPSQFGNMQELVTVYKKRWYALFLFCYACILQGCIWNCWGPIAQSSKASFDWTNGNIALLTSWGNIMNCVVMVPITWMMDVKGLKVSVIVCSIFLMVGAGVRCITSEPTPATWLINFGHILNGIGGTVTFSGPTLTSSTWFPKEQRATATGLCALSCYIGIALAFIVGPQIVPEPPDPGNQTALNVSFHNDVADAVNITSSTDIGPIRNRIMYLMYGEFGFAVLLFLLAVFTFPGKPKIPPALSQMKERESYKTGLFKLVRNINFWPIFLGFSIPTGVYQAWGTVLDVNLDPDGFTQAEAGWLGFYMIIAGCISGIVLSRIADIFTRKLKKIIIISVVIGLLSAVCFTLMSGTLISDIPLRRVWLYIACILSGVVLNGTIPIFYESGCETTYPIAEGVTTGFMTVLQNFVGIIFLAVLQIPDIGVGWMNWFLVASVAIAAPLVVIYKQRYNKTEEDQRSDETERLYDDSDRNKDYGTYKENDPTIVR